MIGHAVGFVAAVSYKTYGSVFLVAVALESIENPVLALGAFSAAVVAIIAAFTKTWHLLNANIENRRRQTVMLALFEGNEYHPGVMDEIRSLHVGQADILLAISDLKRSAVRHRDEDPIL